MYLQPSHPLPGRVVPQEDGSYLMTLLPEDGMRNEWCFGELSERLPVGKPFVWTIETGIVEATAPVGHRWILWQWHAPDDPSLNDSNPFLRLQVQDGIGLLQALHEFSVPYSKPKQVYVDLATVELKPGRRYKFDVESLIGKDGYIRIRKDGMLVADYKGPFGFDFTGMVGPYAKCGVYKWQQPWNGRIIVTVKFATNI